MKNRIPRKFNHIKGELLINTLENRKGDILHIHKSNYGYYVALNTRTQNNMYCFVSMLRDAEIFRIIEIV